MMYNRKAQFVSDAGGTLTVSDYETGETLVKVPVPAGLVPMARYSDLAGIGDWSVSDGLAVISPRSGYAVQSARDRYKTGANPDWRPSVHTEMQRQVQSMVKQMLPTAIKEQARQRQMDRLLASQMPTRRVDPEPEVIEAQDQAPEPEPIAPVSDDPKQ